MREAVGRARFRSKVLPTAAEAEVAKIARTNSKGVTRFAESQIIPERQRRSTVPINSHFDHEVEAFNSPLSLPLHAVRKICTAPLRLPLPLVALDRTERPAISHRKGNGSRDPIPMLKFKQGGIKTTGPFCCHPPTRANPPVALTCGLAPDPGILFQFQDVRCWGVFLARC